MLLTRGNSYLKYTHDLFQKEKIKKNRNKNGKKKKHFQHVYSTTLEIPIRESWTPPGSRILPWMLALVTRLGGPWPVLYHPGSVETAVLGLP